MTQGERRHLIFHCFSKVSQNNYFAISSQLKDYSQWNLFQYLKLAQLIPKINLFLLLMWNCIDKTIYYMNGDQNMALSTAFFSASLWQQCIAQHLNTAQNVSVTMYHAYSTHCSCMLRAFLVYCLFIDCATCWAGLSEVLYQSKIRGTTVQLELYNLKKI